MRDDVRQQWTTALRSGEYKQGYGMLHRKASDGEPDKFCCLGVLCDLAVKAGVTVSVTECEDANHYCYDGTCGVLPSAVQEWAGISSENPRVNGRALSAWNDYLEVSFSEVADLVDGYMREEAIDA